MNGFHLTGGLNADDWVRMIAIVMALTVIIGTAFTRGYRIPRQAVPTLLLMALIWVAIIATAAIAFRHFRPGGM